MKFYNVKFLQEVKDKKILEKIIHAIKVQTILKSLKKKMQTAHNPNKTLSIVIQLYA
jgi:hypothetical protein